MIIGDVKGRILLISGDDVITVGSVGMQMQFIFDEEWDDLSKIVIFMGSGNKIGVHLDETNIVTIPYETLLSIDNELAVGVYGQNGQSSIVIPTIWAKVRMFVEGVDPSDAQGASAPSQTWTAYIEQIATDAEDTAHHADDLSMAMYEYLVDHGMPDQQNLLRIPSFTVDGTTLIINLGSQGS